jgi:hypothetical protein
MPLAELLLIAMQRIEDSAVEATITPKKVNLGQPSAPPAR